MIAKLVRICIISMAMLAVAGCASTPRGTVVHADGAQKPAASKKASQARDPSKIYGDPALDEAYREWAADGYRVPDGANRFDLSGKASWYGPGLNGNKTASGEVFDMYGMTAAHKKLPFGSIVVVTNLDNQKSVIVRINDRGPFIAGRVIDLSYGAAYLIDMVRAGVVPVKVEVIRLGKTAKKATK